MHLIFALLILLFPSYCFSAELLVKAVDATNIDPIKDAGCYKTGDVVVVMPDGHKWGKEEGAPKFKVVKVPDLSVEEAKDMYLNPDKATNKRRGYRVDIQLISTKEKSGAVTIDDLDSCVINKSTGKTAVQEKSEKATP